MLFKDKPRSIGEAAASGFLKVPEVKEPAKTTTEQSSIQAGAGTSIADAAKSGFLKVPTVGEKKGKMAAESYHSLCFLISSFLEGLLLSQKSVSL